MAFEDVWFVGDFFLREIFNTFSDMNKYAIRNRSKPPYLYGFYNIFGYFQNKISSVRGIARIYNAFLEGMNNRKRLPRFIIMVMDKDFIVNVNYFAYSVSEVMENMMELLTSKINANIDRRKQQLFNVKPGAMSLFQTKIVWVKMIKRPYGSLQEFSHIFALRNKMNNAIEKSIVNVNPQQYLLSIKVDHNDFHPNGELSEDGQKSFW